MEFEVHSHKVEKFPLECEEIIYYDGAYLPLVNGVPVRADKNNDVSLKFLNSWLDDINEEFFNKYPGSLNSSYRTLYVSGEICK